MLKVGSLFAERYNILEYIAAGGMADVYKAEDVLEKRPVAIKILKPELSDDKEFVRRFKIEGQATSSLDCENIVRVYDVGNVGDVYYIAMELIDGITLKQYIRRKGALSPRETMAIASQVAVGLRAAHSHHVIHRDIKPQNIILSRDGKAKVTDFGIARAITDETRTLNVATMGSVHYIAPEQAKGLVCDERSDIYSLGICMYEMITGRVPFDKETSVAIALAHMNERMVPPSEINPECSKALEQIIFRCTQKSSARRYKNCSELLKDLKTAVANPNFDFEKQEQEHLLKSNTQIIEKKAAAGAAAAAAGAAAVTAAGAKEGTKTAEAAGTAGKKAAGAAAGAAAAGVAKTGMKTSEAAGTVMAENAADVPAGKPARTRRSKLNDFEEVEDRKPAKKEEADDRKEDAAAVKAADPKAAKRRDRYFGADGKAEKKPLFDRILTIVSLVIGAACVLMVVYLIGSLSGCIGGKSDPRTTAAGTTESTEQTMENITLETIAQSDFDPEIHTVVPNIVGMGVQSAIQALTDAELEYYISEKVLYSDIYPIGTVAEQNYEEGTIVFKGSPIVFAMSCGTDKFVIKESYIGGLLDSFKNDISNYTSAIHVTYERILSDSVPVNRIISLDPSEGVLAEGDSIHVVYSGGPAHVAVPDIRGMTYEQASSKLDTAGLTRGEVSREYDHDVPEGRVIRQQYDPGTSVSNGSKVDFVLSLGPETAEIPDVIGMDEATAVDQLESLGFRTEVVDYYKPAPGEETPEDTDAEETDEDGPDEDDPLADPDVYADVEPGRVAAVAPKVGYEYPLGDKVRIFVLRAATEGVIPDVLGMEKKDALDLLNEQGFTSVTVKDRDAETSAEIGLVIEIEPSVGTEVPLADEVILYVGVKPAETSTEAPSTEATTEAPTESSTEPPTEPVATATIPKIMQSLEENVEGSLRAVGFTNIRKEYEYVTDPDLIGVVVRVTPEVGSTIPVTDEIVYYIGREQPSTEEASEPSLDAEQGEAPGEGGN